MSANVVLRSVELSFYLEIIWISFPLLFGMVGYQEIGLN